MAKGARKRKRSTFRVEINVLIFIENVAWLFHLEITRTCNNGALTWIHNYFEHERLDHVLVLLLPVVVPPRRRRNQSIFIQTILSSTSTQWLSVWKRKCQSQVVNPSHPPTVPPPTDPTPTLIYSPTVTKTPPNIVSRPLIRLDLPNPFPSGMM